MKINERALIHFANARPWVDREGHLWKKGELNTSYQKRWCVLQGNLLFYYEKRHDKEPMGVIVLEQCTVQLAEGGDSPYTFSIKFTGPGLRTYKLMADDEETCNNWIKSLSLSSYRYLKILVEELEREKADPSATTSQLLQLAAPMRSTQSRDEKKQKTKTHKSANTESESKKAATSKGGMKPVKIIEENRNGVRSKTIFHKSATSDQMLVKVDYSGKTKLRNKSFTTADCPDVHCAASAVRTFPVLHEFYRKCIEEGLGVVSDDVEELELEENTS